MTQKELGMAAGMGPAYMGMVESGKQNLSLETIWKLAQGLELSVELLLSEDDIWAEPTEKSVKQLIRAVENMATELSRLRGQEGELVKTADGLLQAGRKLLEQFGESTSRRDPKSHK
jgi:transcriptional regulator with XRE-family HTH domain